MATKKSNQPANQPRGGQVVHQQWEAPLPPPAALDHYETILHGAAERILIMAEKEQQPRHDYIRALEHLAEKETNQNGNSVFRGQLFGFLSIATCIGCAFASAYLHFHPTISLGFLAMPIFSAIKTMINRQHIKKN